MLSKIYKGKEVEKLQIKKYDIPSLSKIEPGLDREETRNKRKKAADIIKNEPQTTASNDTYQILYKAREKLTEAENENNRLNTRLENQLMELVFSICHKVIGKEIKTSPDVVLNMVKRGLEKIKKANKYEIKVNPGEYDTFIRWQDEIKAILKTPGTITFTKDENVEAGGCQIITEHGEMSTEPGRQEAAP